MVWVVVRLEEAGHPTDERPLPRTVASCLKNHTTTSLVKVGTSENGGEAAWPWEEPPPPLFPSRGPGKQAPREVLLPPVCAKPASY